MAQIDDGRLFCSPPLAVFDGIFAEFIELKEKLIHEGIHTAVSNLMGATMCLMQKVSEYEPKDEVDRADIQLFLTKMLTTHSQDAPNKDGASADLIGPKLFVLFPSTLVSEGGDVIIYGVLSYRTFYLNPRVSDMISQNLLICLFADLFHSVNK